MRLSGSRPAHSAYSHAKPNDIIFNMAYLTEDSSYKLWELAEKSWEGLYNLLYKDYYEGGKIGLDNDLVYQIMQVAQRFQSNEAQFPQTHDQFYETLNQQLEG